MAQPETRVSSAWNGCIPFTAASQGDWASLRGKPGGRGPCAGPLPCGNGDGVGLMSFFKGGEMSGSGAMRIAGAATALIILGTAVPAVTRADEPAQANSAIVEVGSDGSVPLSRFNHLVQRLIIRKVAVTGAARLIDYRAAVNRQTCKVEGLGTYTVRKPPQNGTLSTGIIYGQLTGACPKSVFAFTGLYYTPKAASKTIDRFELRWREKIPSFLGILNIYYRVATPR